MDSIELELRSYLLEKRLNKLTSQMDRVQQKGEDSINVNRQKTLYLHSRFQTLLQGLLQVEAQVGTEEGSSSTHKKHALRHVMRHGLKQLNLEIRSQGMYIRGHQWLPFIIAKSEEDIIRVGNTLEAWKFVS